MCWSIPHTFILWTARLCRGTLNVPDPWERTAFVSYAELGPKHTKINEEAVMLKEERRHKHFCIQFRRHFVLAVSSFMTRCVEISCPAGALMEDAFVGIIGSSSNTL